MDTLSETADKVDQSLQNMGIEAEHQGLSEFQGISGRAAACIYRILYQGSSVDHCIFCRPQDHMLDREHYEAFYGACQCGCWSCPVYLIGGQGYFVYTVDL